MISPLTAWSLSSIFWRTSSIDLRVAAFLRLHLQPQRRAARAADLADDFRQLHVEDVFDFAVALGSTPTILSPTFRRPSRAAAPPGTIEATTV